MKNITLLLVLILSFSTYAQSEDFKTIYPTIKRSTARGIKYEVDKSFYIKTILNKVNKEVVSINLLKCSYNDCDDLSDSLFINFTEIKSYQQNYYPSIFAKEKLYKEMLEKRLVLFPAIIGMTSLAPAVISFLNGNKLGVGLFSSIFVVSSSSFISTLDELADYRSKIYKIYKKTAIAESLIQILSSPKKSYIVKVDAIALEDNYRDLEFAVNRL